MKRFKNLLILSNDFPDKNNNYPGSIFVKDQIKYLIDYFENIYVIIPTPHGIEIIRKIKHENYQFSNIKVYFLKYFNNPLFYFFGRSIWLYIEKNAVLKILKQEKIKFDMIHSHFTWHSGATAALLAKEFDVPLVITEHTSDTFLRAVEKKDKIFIKAWKSCDSIIRVRKMDIQFFYDLGIVPKNVHYIPNGFDNKKFRLLDKKFCRGKLNLPLGKKIILNVANLYDKVKGHKYLIESMGKIVALRKDVVCVIVGDGLLRKEIEKQIKKLNLENYVILAGAKSHDEIPLWMNACDLIVLPSLNEGNPTVMFEALGCGKPFVGTRVGGVPEIIINDKLGILVEPKDPEVLAQAILQGLEAEWDVEYILTYAEQFRWENIAEQIMDVYKQLRKERDIN